MSSKLLLLLCYVRHWVTVIDMQKGVGEITEEVQRMHNHHVFQYKVGISLGSILHRTPSPNGYTNKSETDIVYVHHFVNNASLFWSGDHMPSSYRHDTNNSDLEQIITFPPNKEYVSRRADISWNLVGHLNANIPILRINSEQGVYS